jgi:hypothetical protein
LPDAVYWARVGTKTAQLVGCPQADVAKINPEQRTKIILLNRIGHLSKGLKNQLVGIPASWQAGMPNATLFPQKNKAWHIHYECQALIFEFPYPDPLISDRDFSKGHVGFSIRTNYKISPLMIEFASILHRLDLGVKKKRFTRLMGPVGLVHTNFHDSRRKPP